MVLPIQLFSVYDLQSDSFGADKIDIQEVIDYSEARFQAALPVIMVQTENVQKWMLSVLCQELVGN